MQADQDSAVEWRARARAIIADVARRAPMRAPHVTRRELRKAWRILAQTHRGMPKHRRRIWYQEIHAALGKLRELPDQRQLPLFAVA